MAHAKCILLRAFVWIIHLGMFTSHENVIGSVVNRMPRTNRIDPFCIVRTTKEVESYKETTRKMKKNKEEQIATLIDCLQVTIYSSNFDLKLHVLVVCISNCSDWWIANNSAIKLIKITVTHTFIRNIHSMRSALMFSHAIRVICINRYCKWEVKEGSRTNYLSKPITYDNLRLTKNETVICAKLAIARMTPLKRNSHFFIHHFCVCSKSIDI